MDDPVETIWHRLLEVELAVVPVGFGAFAFFAGILASLSGSSAEGPFATVVGILLIAAIPLAILFALASPILLALDSREVNQGGGDWAPTTALYVLAGVFFSGLAVMEYLYRRSRNVADPDVDDRWWYGAAAGFAMYVLGVLSFVSGVQLGFSVAGIGYALLPVALYKDAVYVRNTGSEWAPGPITYYFLTAIGLAIVFLAPFVLLFVAYYLFKRRGVDGGDSDAGAAAPDATDDGPPGDDVGAAATDAESEDEQGEGAEVATAE